MPSRFQTMKCAASDEFDHIDGVDVAGIFLADALEHPLRAGALDAHRNSRIFRLERLRQLFRDRQVDRGVVDDLAFLLRGVDQGRRDRLRRRCAATTRVENVAPASKAPAPLSTLRRDRRGCFIAHSMRMSRRSATCRGEGLAFVARRGFEACGLDGANGSPSTLIDDEFGTVRQIGRRTTSVLLSVSR